MSRDLTESSVGRAIAGEPDDVEALALAYLPRVYGLSLRLCRDRDLAQEVSQEAYLRILRSLPSLKRPERLTSWVLRITSNVARDHYRRRGKTEPLTYEPPAIEREDDDWDRARGRAIDLALAELNFADRELFLLHTIEGVRLKDLARSHKKSLAAITSQTHRIRARVRALARKHLKEAGVVA